MECADQLSYVKDHCKDETEFAENSHCADHEYRKLTSQVPQPGEENLEDVCLKTIIIKVPHRVVFISTSNAKITVIELIRVIRIICTRKLLRFGDVNPAFYTRH